MTPKRSRYDSSGRRVSRILAVLVVSVWGGLSIASPLSDRARVADASSNIQDHIRGKIYIGPDAIIEEYGAREAAYEGFLYLSELNFPDGYVEKSHHYTKNDYLIDLEKRVGTTSYPLKITESAGGLFFEPNMIPIEEFDYAGRHGRIYSHGSRTAAGSRLDLYWFKAPKQRLTISVAQTPMGQWQPNDLIDLLKAMTLASDVPALVTPFPKPQVDD